MKLWTTIKKHPRYAVIPLLCVFLTFYFVYHTITGKRGLLTFWALKSEIQKEEQIAKDIHQKRLDMQTTVSALSPESMDLDMLDEIGRKTLNVSDKDDYLIFENDTATQKTPPSESSD